MYAEATPFHSSPPIEGVVQASSRSFQARNLALEQVMKTLWDEAFEAGARFQRDQQNDVIQMLAAECERLSAKVIL